VDDRRYRQAGYRSGERREDRREPPRPPSPRETLKSRPLSRCAECGTRLPVASDSLTQCPSCRAELHACRQCSHFDPGRRFECAQAVPERIADKRARNECASFSLLVTVERDTSSGSVRPDDARRAFGDLFKK
jgi:hypothetical protein